jgi:predicted transcriptional regulator
MKIMIHYDEQLTQTQSQILKSLGANLELAIKRRRLRRQDVAEKAGISVPTLRKMIQGDSGVRIGAWVTVLDVLDLLDDLGKVAAPQHDEIGLAAEKRHLPKRSRIIRSKYDF